jgi:hypothetical protein
MNEFKYDRRLYTVVRSIATHTALGTKAFRLGQDSGLYSDSLHGLGKEFRWARDIPDSSRPALGPSKPLVQWEPSFFTRRRATGMWH